MKCDTFVINTTLLQQYVRLLLLCMFIQMVFLQVALCGGHHRAPQTLINRLLDWSVKLESSCHVTGNSVYNTNIHKCVYLLKNACTSGKS